jgi:co-chaperonin GroES (HSP10)
MLTRRQIPLFHSPILSAVAFCLLYSSAGLLGQNTPQSPSADVAKVVGAIQSITSDTIVLKKDDGSESTVTVQQGARLARVAPGQKDLKAASAIELRDLQVGDRILVRGQAGPDGKSITATIILAMKKADVEAKQQSDRQDWQRRGVGGVVTSVDTAAGSVAVSTASFREKKIITIHTTPKTIVRRYAPDSVKFDDAKVGTLAEMKA